MEFNNVINSVTITSRQFVGIGYDNISNNYSDIRTSDNLSDSLKITRDYIETNERNIDDSINIYRYKFTNDFTNELYKFSKIHQYDHRKDFKEAWEIWIDDNSNLVDDEVRRLTNLGYDGDVLDKMFKSARYYFRKKSTEKKEPVKRRIYVGSQKDLLEAMDDHIKCNISSGEFKPADGFDEFCKKNVDILKDQVNQLIRSGITDSNEIKSKIKKTYK